MKLASRRLTAKKLSFGILINIIQREKRKSKRQRLCLRILVKHTLSYLTLRSDNGTMMEQTLKRLSKVVDKEV